MYNMMNGGTIWGMGSSWFIACTVIILGVISLIAYFGFIRRK